MQLPLRSLFLLCSLVVSASAQTLFTYTATGGLISGSLNGTPFTDATWSATATADPSTRVYIDTPTRDWNIDATLSLTISDSSNTFTVSMPVSIFSRDYTVYFGEAHGAAGFEYGGGAIYIDSVDGYTGLNASAVINGQSGFDDHAHLPFATSGGDLIIVNNSNQQPGSFTVSEAAPIPEPATWSVLAGAGALGFGLYRVRRRQQKA